MDRTVHFIVLRRNTIQLCRKSVQWTLHVSIPDTRQRKMVCQYRKVTNPWRRVLEKLTGFQVVKQLHVFYETRWCVTTFNSSPPVPILSQKNTVHVPHTYYWRSILVLSLHLRVGIPNFLIVSRFPTSLPPFVKPNTRKRISKEKRYKWEKKEMIKERADIHVTDW
jgi:hypothetical protein